jgi:hypothetical protein
MPHWAQKPESGAVPEGVSVTTLITLPRTIEGMTGDNGDNLYTSGSGAPPWPLWLINIHRPALTVVGNVPASLTSTCALRGLALDAQGRPYALDQIGVVYRVTPNA